MIKRTEEEWKESCVKESNEWEAFKVTDLKRSSQNSLDSLKRYIRLNLKHQGISCCFISKES